MSDERAPLPALAHDMLLADLASLPPRALAPLYDAGITTVGQVAMMTDRELLRIGWLGPVGVRRIREIIPYWTETQTREDRCERCRCWDGRCHRYAPRPSSVPVPSFPQTAPGDWCIEFEPRKPSEMMRAARAAPPPPPTTDPGGITQ